MICFISNINIPTLPSLISHYKIIRLLGPHSSYTCKENNCLQSFQTLSSFKKHVLIKHKFENNDQTVVSNEFRTNNDDNTFDAEMACNDNNITPIIINASETPEMFNEEVFESIKQLHLFVVQFSLSSHNNNNFCRSDVINIQNDIEKN